MVEAIRRKRLFLSSFFLPVFVQERSRVQEPIMPTVRSVIFPLPFDRGGKGLGHPGYFLGGSNLDKATAELREGPVYPPPTEHDTVEPWQSPFAGEDAYSLV